MLTGKTVILGITGGIAAYKSANIASMLKKLGCDVQVIMTKNAVNFINPIVFETLTGNRCITDTFDRNFQYNVEHVALAKKADIIVVAPATADVIAKMAHGIADDMLTTTVLACNCIKVAVPSMNTRMYENPVTQDNIKTLLKYGFKIIEPATGFLACGDTGAGKFPDEKLIVEHILKEIVYNKELSGIKVLVTAGPTQEAIDPVRYITNHSSGKMGYAAARDCMMRGADVTLVTGETSIVPPIDVETIAVKSAQDMFNAVTNISDSFDIIIKAAAVADYRPKNIAQNKIKKSDNNMLIELESTDDILKYLGEHKKKNQFLCGFSMETENMIENSKAKLKKKNLDLIAANNLTQEGAGFQTDTNVLTLISENSVIELPLTSKDEAAHLLVTRIIEMRNKD